MLLKATRNFFTMSTYIPKTFFLMIKLFQEVWTLLFVNLWSHIICKMVHAFYFQKNFSLLSWSKWRKNKETVEKIVLTIVLCNINDHNINKLYLKNIRKFPCLWLKKPLFVKWHPLKQTKSKIWCDIDLLWLNYKKYSNVL